MNNSPSLVFITSIVPNPENRDGPSGLPWEIIEILKKNAWDVQIEFFQLPTNKICRRLIQLSIPIEKIEIINKDADAYIVYPFYLSRLIPAQLRSRSILLGPDATSMLYSRFARIQAGWQRLRSVLLARWFAFHERWAARHFAAMAVVGRNDVRWLRYIVGGHSARLHYIPHPILSSVAQPRQAQGLGAKPRLIFAGDLSAKYVGNFFQSLDYAALAAILASADCELLVVGKSNRSIHNIISSHVPSQYVAWVDDYSTLCDPLRDLHLIPLMAGAGTKNRALTALAMNVIVISTPIGIENIDPQVLRAASVHRFRSSSDFLRAVAAGLTDLKVRRAATGFIEPPPIARISHAFEDSCIKIVQSLVARTI